MELVRWMSCRHPSLFFFAGEDRSLLFREVKPVDSESAVNRQRRQNSHLGLQHLVEENIRSRFKIYGDR